MISIFENMNCFAERWKALDVLAIFFARYVPYLMVAFLFFYSIYISDIYLFVFALLAALFGRFVLNELVHVFYRKQRPAGLEETKVLIPIPKNSSFPSGHASFFFSISFFLIFYNVYLALIFLILSLFIGTARVFCGVHWFRDVMGGIFVGLISALIIYYLIILI